MGIFFQHQSAPLYFFPLTWLEKLSTALSNFIWLRCAIFTFHVGMVIPSCYCKRFFWGILRYQGHTRTLRQPVTTGDLLAIRPILRSWLGKRDFSMIWAAFTLAFFCFLRSSEFTYQGVSKFRPQFDLSADCLSFHPSLAGRQRCQFFWNLLRPTFFGKGTAIYLRAHHHQFARCWLCVPTF